MPANPKIQSLTFDDTTYDIVDNTSGYAKTVSPNFTGTPTAPTPTSGDDSTKIATTAFVQDAIDGFSSGTITEVKTAAGAHTAIDVTSGKAEFNVPTNTSHLTNDSGFITASSETDPLFVASAAHGITSTDITNWNSKSDFSGSYDDLTNKPTIPTVPTNVSAFTNDAGYLTSYTETDPTVPSWAKASSKPSYSLSEITSADDVKAIEALTGTTGLLRKTAANTWSLDTNTYLTSYTETDPTVPAWAKASTKPSYTASEVGAVATSAVGAASGVVPLNASSKIDSTYLPSYVDDVIEGYYYNNKFWTTSAHTTEITGEAGKIYVDLTTNKTYRYGTSTFTEISQGSLVTVSRDLTSGTKSATITVDGTGYDIYSISAPSSTQSASTGISVADHTTASIYGVGSSTTSVTGVQSSTTSVRGVKTGDNSTTTASHVSGGSNGTTPTLGDPISIIGVGSSTTSVRGVKTGTNSTTTASKVTLGTDISVPNPSASDVTVPIRADSDTTVPTAASSATTVPIKNATATSIPNVTSAGTASSWTFEEKTIPNVTNAGSASSWTFEEKTIPNVTAAGSGSASLSFTIDNNDDPHKLKIAFSHTHTAPTLGTAIKVQSKSGGSNGSAPTLGTAIKVQSKSGGSNGTAPTLGTAISIYGVQSTTTSVTGVSGSTTVRGVKTGTSSTTTASKVTMGTAISVPNVTGATDVTVPIRADSDTTVPIKNADATSVPNVTSVGSASSWTFENVTVPIRAEADTTVPIKNSSATTVPVKDSTSTTVVTGKTHIVTDNGHTHSI